MTNVALITIHALVNSEDVLQSLEELIGRVETHETVTDLVAVVSKACPVLIQSVENGTYQLGALANHYVFTEYTPNGDAVFSNVISST